MDAVTYPHKAVSRELAGHWLTAKVDVGEQKAVAEHVGVAGIPAALALSADGSVLGMILGFVEPEPFARQLSEFLGPR